ncbi:ABC transporter substrate-binding protein [Aurantimonas aggregata]|uniref:ABC transporter substrate-binding protein n=1 Tax=Aurantimonas aggregata TaxID=2047720 RepID=A0A6L9MK48_9HYPH|nr:ABC transporter substrate-binding protein [Aurantimonas aggregata]NDV88213.1 ABC transporter substrate-binding protein [Aurantimonas aggregata]
MRMILSLSALALGIGLAAPSAAQTVVQLGAAQTSAGSLPVVVAMQQGLFERNGITIERTDFAGGGPAVQALASGSIDVCICAADHAVRLQERGLGGKIIVALGDHHLYAIMAPADSEATDLASLQGLQVGVTSAGGLADNTVRWAINEIDLDPDTDYSIIAIGTGGAMRAAVENRAIAAGTFTTPDIQSNLALGDVYKIVHDFRSIPHAAQGIVVLDSWLEGNEETARQFAASVHEALQMVQADQAVLEEAIAEMFPQFEPALVTQVASDVRDDFLSKDGIVGREAYENMMETVAIADPNVEAVPYEDVVSTEYLP